MLTTFPYYPHWQVQEPYRKNRFWYLRETENFASGGRVEIIRCPIYVPGIPSGGKRILLDFSFLLSSFFPLIGLLFQKKIDAVMAVAPSFLVGLPALMYKAWKRCKFYYHIQDLQIDAARDLKIIRSEGLLKVLFGIEKFILQKADAVFTISPEMAAKIHSKANIKVDLLPNWSDTSKIFPLDDRIACKAQFGFQADQKVVLYSGAIGQKQGLESIIEAAAHFESDHNLLFVICGSGPYKTVLEQQVHDRKLKNLLFLPLQPLAHFNAFLNAADVHLVIQKESASDLMLPSKLTNILAVGGVAIVTANEGTGLRNLIKDYNLAYGVDAEDKQQLFEAIGLIVAGTPLVAEIKKGALSYTMRYLDQTVILSGFQSTYLR